MGARQYSRREAGRRSAPATPRGSSPSPSTKPAAVDRYSGEAISAFQVAPIRRCGRTRQSGTDLESQYPPRDKGRPTDRGSVPGRRRDCRDCRARPEIRESCDDRSRVGKEKSESGWFYVMLMRRRVGDGKVSCGGLLQPLLGSLSLARSCCSPPGLPPLSRAY